MHMHENHKRGLADKVLFLIRSIQVETQGDSGEKVRIFGGDTIGHCETKKKFTRKCV